MKQLLAAALLFFAHLALAQDEHLMPKDKWSKDLYISDEFCAGKGLKPGEVNELLIAWNNLGADARFSRVVDIRWYFASPAAASDYLTGNIKELSENGDPVSAKLAIPGTSGLRVFRESASTRKMNAALGMKINMYYFLFTVRNYVAKVFISSEKEITVDEAAVFAVEAAKRLNKAAH